MTVEGPEVSEIQEAFLNCRAVLQKDVGDLEAGTKVHVKGPGNGTLSVIRLSDMHAVHPRSYEATRDDIVFIPEN